MWTTENRHRYDRDKLRYPSDLTDAEWQQIKPLIPPAKRGGGKRTVNMREVVNGVMYVLSTGCQWRYIPKDLPPRSTVNGYFCLWGWDGTLEKIHHALYVKCREQAEREASPTACMIDSQSVKSAEKGALHRSAWLRRRQADQGQEASRPGRQARPAAARAGDCRRCSGSRRRRAVAVHPVRTVPVPAQAVRRQRLCRADLPGRRRHSDAQSGGRDRQTRDGAKGFVVEPKRWIVERTIGWLNRCRRLAKDWENRNHNALAFLHLASIRLMLRKLCNPS